MNSLTLIPYDLFTIRAVRVLYLRNNFATKRTNMYTFQYHIHNSEKLLRFSYRILSFTKRFPKSICMQMTYEYARTQKILFHIMR